jgi:hypothetical protein
MFAELPKGGLFCIVVASMFPLLILVAVVVKMWEIWKAKSWLAAEGKVIASRVQTRTIESDTGDSSVINEPFVQYEFKVGSQKYRGTRITIGEKISNSDLEPILARYSVGKAVTVYYDPADPKKCLLERDLGMSKTTLAAGFGVLMLVFVGGPLALAFGYFNGLEWFKSHLANPRQAPIVTVLGLFGLGVLFFAQAFSRMVRQAARWPVAKGTILGSGTRAVAVSDGEGSRTHYRSSVLYRYTVNSREYKGDRIALGVSVSSTLPVLARMSSAKYRAGQQVNVHYNPAAPGESVLNVNSKWHIVPWMIAAVILTFTWAVATGRM